MSSNQYMVSQVEKRGLARTLEDEIKVVDDPLRTMSPIVVWFLHPPPDVLSPGLLLYL
jgi:hypothetical protein